MDSICLFEQGGVEWDVAEGRINWNVVCVAAAERGAIVAGFLAFVDGSFGEWQPSHCAEREIHGRAEVSGD